MEEMLAPVIAIPQSLENLQLPSPELLTFYTDLDERIIWMDDEVSNMTLEIARYIMQWNREDAAFPVEDRRPIKLMFFSPGGSLYVNNLLIDVITASRTPVYGYNLGMAFSAGAFIYLACHKRFALPRATFLFHKGDGAFSGITANVASASKEYDRQINELVDFVVERTNIPRNTASKKMNSDWYITAAEAKDKYAFVDEIITSLDQI